MRLYTYILNKTFVFLFLSSRRLLYFNSLSFIHKWGQTFLQYNTNGSIEFISITGRYKFPNDTLPCIKSSIKYTVVVQPWLIDERVTDTPYRTSQLHAGENLVVASETSDNVIVAMIAAHARWPVFFVLLYCDVFFYIAFVRKHNTRSFPYCKNNGGV